MVSHDLRLSDGQSLTLDSFAHDLDEVQNEQITSYMAVFPIDISPLTNGKISVQQASNQPVDLIVYLSQYFSKNLHATNETEGRCWICICPVESRPTQWVGWFCPYDFHGTNDTFSILNPRIW